MPTLELISDKAFLIHDVYDASTCAALIAWSEQHGFEPATFGGKQRVEGVRNNDRIIQDDQERALDLWSIIADALPDAWRHVEAFSRFARGPHLADGLNERFRWYRYHPGQRFSPHVDSVYRRPAPSKQVSMLTALIFLNEDFEAGGTRLWLDKKTTHTVSPKTGSMLCFDHGLMHEGVCVNQGTKYILRTDIMYSPAPS